MATMRGTTQAAQWCHRCAAGLLAIRPLMSEGASQAKRRPPCPLETDDEQSRSRQSEDEEELQLLTDDLQRAHDRISASSAKWTQHGRAQVQRMGGRKAKDTQCRNCCARRG